MSDDERALRLKYPALIQSQPALLMKAKNLQDESEWNTPENYPCPQPITLEAAFEYVLEEVYRDEP